MNPNPIASALSIDLDLDEMSARSLAQAVGRSITAGDLQPGTRLPTVRSLARQCGLSPATISEAWQLLRHAGLIDTAGRNGTTVIGGRTPPSGVGRYGQVAGIGRQLPINLATGTPDPELLADITPLVSDVDFSTSVVDYLSPPVEDGLRTLLLDEWPFPPGALTIVNGAMDGLVRIARQIVPFGARVAIENPTFPPLIDTLEQLGASLIPVDMDSDGPTPRSLEIALDHNPVALFIQPRAQNPTGTSMSAERASELARLLSATDSVIVENDHAARISTSAPVSLGSWLPERTVRIEGFSKSHGPDLRLAAVGGNSAVVETVTSNRTSGPGWSSRLLQRILLQLLTDERSESAVSHARQVYAKRRAALVSALRERDVAVECEDGLNLWLPVADEGRTLVTLAAQGISVAPGAAFCVEPVSGGHVRVTVGLVKSEDADDIAAILAGSIDS